MLQQINIPFNACNQFGFNRMSQTQLMQRTQSIRITVKHIKSSHMFLFI